jgi:hypothetical protein
VRRRSVKRSLTAWCEAQIRLQVAEEIAEATRRSVPLPDHYCPPPARCVGCARWEQAQADADLAVELGGLGGAR